MSLGLLFLTSIILFFELSVFLFLCCETFVQKVCTDLGIIFHVFSKQLEMARIASQTVVKAKTSSSSCKFLMVLPMPELPVAANTERKDLPLPCAHYIVIGSCKCHWVLPLCARWHTPTHGGLERTSAHGCARQTPMADANVGGRDSWLGAACPLSEIPPGEWRLLSHDDWIYI